jgi:3-hydroxyisobutyrate dehydrogenase
MAKVALLGTGWIGAAMAEGMLRRGDTVAVWNRTASRAAPLAALGAEVHRAPAEAVRGAERVHVVVSDDEAVDDVLRQLPALPESTLVVDHSTVSPAGVKARFATAPGAFLHAPIFMSPQAARASTGIMLCAGPRARFERAAPALSAMTGTLRWVGERVDQAAALKLFGNAMILTICAGLSDVYRMARALGIEPTEAHALFSTFNPAMAIEVRGAKMAQGDFSPSFETTMARKDVRLMTEACDALHVLPAVAALLDRAIAAGHGPDDCGSIAFDVFERPA